MSKRISIAIIGCGAASVTLLRYLVEFSVKIKFSNIKIIVFEPSDTFGVGLAYQADLNNLIINRPIQTMSAHAVNLDEFHHWLEQRSDLAGKKIVESSVDGDRRSYASRKIFGFYLEDLLRGTIEDAKNNKIEITLIKKEIVEINTVNPFTLKSLDGTVYVADFVILCTGNNMPKDIFKLTKTPQYINNPYPIFRKLNTLKQEQCVGIIGNSLTAIDIAISLNKLGHKGPITMLSRMKAYPRIRGKIVRHQLKFFNTLQIKSIKKRKGCFTLRDALRLLRQELKYIYCDWRLLFVDNGPNEDFLTFMRGEVDASKEERKWQSVLSATNQVIELCWHYLDGKSKRLFLSKFNRLWLRNRSPIPIENAKLLIEMAEQDQLYMVSSLKEITYHNANKKYVASFKSKDPIIFDCIINATGPSKYVQPEDTLMYRLIKNGFVRENIFGGLDVDFESSSIIDKNGKENYHFRVIGHNTAGVHYYTSSLEMISKRSSKVAESLINYFVKLHVSIQQRNNAEGALGEKLPNPAYQENGLYCSTFNPHQ